MTDLENLRLRLVPLLEPCRRVVWYIKVEETLRGPEPELFVQAEIVVDTGKLYPRPQYPENPPTFSALYASRREALEDVEAQVLAELPKWQQEIQDDEELATKVGMKIRVLKRDDYVDGVALKAENDAAKLSWAEAVNKHTHHVQPGMEGTVIEHYPGRLKVDIEGRVFWVYRWKFHTGYYKGDSQELTPEPYYELF